MIQPRSNQPTVDAMVRFCSYDCKYAEPREDVPGCMTFNPIYCKAQEKIVSKGMKCEYLDK